MEKQTAEKQIDPRFKIGMRNIKTALSVGVCILFFQFIGFSDGIQAAIAAIICMKSSLQNSIQTGIERVIGTSIGAVLGILALLLIERVDYQIATLLAITGVALIIYLCNIFKVQASTVISLVVFLIILIGEKDLPPILYGIMRLVETVFGIAAAYIINRFFDPRHIQKWKKEQTGPLPEIREATPDDLAHIMSIWLESNLSSHPFINPLYWHRTYDSVRNRYRDTAKVLVYESTGQITGFISILNDMDIDGLHVNVNNESQEIEDRLLRHCQELFACLNAKVYSNNQRYLDVLLKAGFYIVGEGVEGATGAEQYTMAWSPKS
ncbi:MAG: aromatic acid exporter family protein [Anaerovoracaceae bacterium]